jgi:chemotaxis protein methyltransferase CheR
MGGGDPTPRAPATDPAVERIELEVFLEAIWRRYGLDFRSYARSSLGRRVRESLRLLHLPSVSSLQERVLRDPETMERVLSLLCVNVTSMFRDPTFFSAFREKVVPRLAGLPLVRVWCAGCATGEEAWSVAIALHEAGLYARSRIYATDLAEGPLEQARAAVYPADLVREYTANYLRAGGEAALSDYYTARYDSVIVRGFLKKNVLFSQHDLVTDEAFNEFDVILCRNVLIYFDAALQERVHGLFHRSLRPGGILALGRADHLPGPVRERYATLDGREHVYARGEREKAGGVGVRR